MDSTMSSFDRADDLLSLPDGTVYDSRPLSEHDQDVYIGDRFVFVADDDRGIYIYHAIHQSVVTVAHISEHGLVALDEYGNPGSRPESRWHFLKSRLHRIISVKEVDLSGFDDIFT